MDIEATLETIASAMPENMDLTGILSDARSFIPADLDFIHIARFLLLFAAGAMILSILGRFILGKHSSLNHSLSSAMGILFIYAFTITLYTLMPWSDDHSLSPLPFVTFFNDYLVVMPVVGIYPTVLARELLNLIILAFFVNLFDTFLPRGKTMPGWYCLRFFMAGISMCCYILIHWAFHTYAPSFLVEYAPLILLLILVAMLLLGFLNAVLGLILTVTNPFIGAFYYFFFSNIVGKQLTKAVFTSGILCVIIFIMDQAGYSFINISMTALTAYVPVALISLVLWYLIGHLL